ncbi:hypothetical protein COB21_01245 [Candidatus Aerophobetes bacterium]|uniref:HEAT repeat domain-containing protein n=1 Tax=Aerophobetes bacterium TaxID=2030807 RepID=A0A2A4X6T3_UNCAE|nr:MAG: hypothetical protein COB21_01245 [Candidatus Aerophobetes bacterium]
MYKFYIALIFFCSICSGTFAQEKLEFIQSHMIMKDFETALHWCKEGLKEDGENLQLKKMHVKILANMHLDFEALQCWKSYFLNQETMDYDLIETLGWSVLNACSKKNNPQLHATLLSGAFAADDVRAVKMLAEHLDSPNSFIRVMALQLSSRYRDEMIIEKIQEMVTREKVWFVRLEAIKALGMLQAGGSRLFLRKIITNDRALDEEKQAAAIAVVGSYGLISKHELASFLCSKRAGLRALGCNIIGFLDKQDSGAELYSLLKDPSPQVRLAALSNLYLIGICSLSSENAQQLATICDDGNPYVSVLASWVFAPYFMAKSVSKLRSWMQSSRKDVKCMAAYFLAKIGKKAQKEIVLTLKNSMDPFVRLNMALGMLGSEVDNALALEEIAFFLKNNQKKIMHFTPSFSLCSLVLPSKVRHTPQVPRYPNMVDNMARLDLLKILASLQYAGATESIREFLKNHQLGVSFTAANLLIGMEGQKALEIIKKFLDDEDVDLRLQAAIVLCANGDSDKALPVLEKLFYQVDRNRQIGILQAIASVGCKKSISFLLTLLDEPYAIIRLLASAAMIQCAYH